MGSLGAGAAGLIYAPRDDARSRAALLRDFLKKKKIIPEILSSNLGLMNRCKIPVIFAASMPKLT